MKLEDLKYGQAFETANMKDIGRFFIRIHGISVLDQDDNFYIAIDNKGELYDLDHLPQEIEPIELKAFNKFDEPYQYDDCGPCDYHGTTKRELLKAEKDPNARRINPFDSQDDIIVRIGDRVATKYGDEFIIKRFDDSQKPIIIHFEETDKPLESHRITYKIEKDYQ